MKTNFSIIILLVVTAMIACTKTPDSSLSRTPFDEPNKDTSTVGLRPDTVNVSHYILSFVQPKSFTTQALKNGGEIWVYFDARHYSGHKDADIQPYTTLCDRYGDMAYEQQRIFAAVEEQGFGYLADNIVSIEVVCETNYDEQHPAGSSLNDICVLEAESPYKHIKSGYTLTHDWPKAEVGQRQKDKGSIPFSKPLTECTAEDMTLMGNGSTLLCKLNLTKLPTPGTKQLITITLTEETGKTYTTTTEPFTW